ncbi:hypothetical protein [Vibrio algivorus]|uniref:Uncharacterized protein n=1 Tax=Vibrio algivorus TaxID=1667024 RepID=A0A557NRU8_9VIBR|nr:hypothetical protein [Vibrio algivorus]TVO31025.1 hypothetical protein FOF44_18190 [Vibrio algivorus]
MELPSRISIKFEALEMFEGFQQGNPESYPFWDHELTKLWEDFLVKMEAINDWVSGSIRKLELVTIPVIIEDA